MFSSRFCLICVVTVLCISSCIGSFHAKKCAETDKQALLKLKHGFIHGRQILSSRNELGAEDLNSHVAGRSVVFFNIFAPLGGKIDSSICELHHLTFLDLSSNELEGGIPKCIGSLGQLIGLKLALNELVGSIPRTLTNLSKLQNLDLRKNNNLVTNDLEWLPYLFNLRYLGLSYIDLSRAIGWPSSISKIFPYLLELYLNDCELPQVNPKFVLHMNSSTSLQILSLSGNELNFSILSWVLNGSKVLTGLGFASNSLHSVPDSIANMISLQYLDLSDNELVGSIMKSFQTLSQLKELILSVNKLSGQLSDYLSKLCSAQDGLESLALDQNPFSSGPLPDFSCFSSEHMGF
ncbi:Inactive leucine-rich repeat receptor protein kinase IMK2 [Spatholobus suberectus]|nr:Inactive leucine-rich repeat receptor protein kinase IMK2 [Spatholobus suberectus]